VNTSRRPWRAAACLAILGWLHVQLGAATQEPTAPPPPSAPDVITRDPAGRVAVRAVRAATPLDIDGVLDEGVYADVLPMSDFIQIEPQEGLPATQQTEVWLLFDDEYVYVSARCWDSNPERMVANEMRRDNGNITQNELFAFSLDTFYDRRNGVLFNTNPIGGRMDGQITNETQFNGDWNPIWRVVSGRFDGGWTVEAAIPFRSLRYRPGREQIWGFNVLRNNRWKNEITFLTPIPAVKGSGLGIMMMSAAATVYGLEAPAGSRNLELKPFAITDLTSDRTATPPVSNDLSGDLGLDVKYGITQNLVADLTVNTDFAQVEADQQQVNLTRFSLFFPEKREFFLENQGTFAFGGAGANLIGGDPNTPILFYSRRIGLDRGRDVPLDVGGRLTGRMGAFSVGALNIRSGDEPVSGARATNFSVVRVKRDLLRRSSVGAIFTRRSQSIQSAGPNESYGLDGTFAFYDNVLVNTYWAKTRTRGFEDDVSYRAQFDYTADRYGLQVERLVVGTDFNPEVGFLRRDDFERSFGSVRFSPRPRSIAAIRKVSYSARLDYITNRAGLLETREAQGRVGIEFESSDSVDVTYTKSYELLTEPFSIAPDVTIPVGGYNFQDMRASLKFGQQRRVSGTLSAQHGGFLSGDRTSVGFTGGRVEVTPQLSMEPGVSVNWIDLPEGRFSTRLVTARTTYTFTPLMFVSALVQVNSSNDSLGANIRLRWEYQPGSELFVVYNEQRDTLDLGFPALANRTFIVKINRLFNF
jgi:hypothetical protein